MRAPTAARFLENEQPLVFQQHPSDAGPIQLTFRTRYSNEGHESAIPRELWIEARGTAISLKAAINAYWKAAAGSIALIAFVANAGIGELQVDLAFDATPGHHTRQMFKNFVVGDVGLPRPGRHTDIQTIVDLVTSINSLPAEEGNAIHQALVFYSMALTHWVAGQETFVLSYLNQGVEALTPVILRQYKNQTGLTRDQLAKQWGVDQEWNNISNGAKITRLKSAARLNLIFHGDGATYTEARKVRNGFQHAIAPFTTIRQFATASRDKSMEYLRGAIVDLAGVSAATRDVIMIGKYFQPLGWFKAVDYHWIELETEVDDVASPEYQYPDLFIKRELSSFSSDGKNMTFAPTYTYQARVADGVTLKIVGHELFMPQDPV